MFLVPCDLTKVTCTGTSLMGITFFMPNTHFFGCCLFLLCYYCYHKVSMMLIGGYVIPWALVFLISGNIYFSISYFADY